MYFRPALRFNLLPPPPPEKKDEERSAKEQNDTKGVEATAEGRDVDIKGVEEREYEEWGAKAVEAFKAGNYTDALQGFNKALELGRNLAGVSNQQNTLLSNRSACYERLGQYAEALDDCATILKALGAGPSKSKEKVQKRRKRILDLLLEKGQYHAALVELMVTFLLDMEAYKWQVRVNPSAAQNMQLLPPSNLDDVAKKAARKMIEDMEAAGNKLSANKSLPSAYTIQQVLNLLPSYQELRGRLSSLREAEQITAELNALPPSSSPSSSLPLHFERALSRIAHQQFSKANEDLMDAVRLAREEGASLPTEEEQANLFSWAGTFLHLKHDLDEARKVLEHSSNLNPDSPELLIKRGCLHLDRSELEEAKVLLEKARETSPTSAFVYLWRCQFWMSGKMTEEGLQEAERELNKCLELDEGNVVALIRLMNIKMQRNETAEAEKLIEKAKRAAPRNADVVAAYAEFLLMQGKVEEAGKELEKSIRLDPSNPMPHINKALVAWQGEDAVTARETLQHVIEMDPQYQPAYSFLANLLFKGVSTVEDSKPAFEIIDKGMQICRSKDDLEELAQIKVLAMAKLDGAKRLGLTAGDLMG
ncbi:hypothetical protein NSK_001732 [Nannochloropsis salina CCMP1776]|uniref:Uncharacterized protein n=1 Tax=Nannochloropsis salina CCMP1776 TaxID=1027361 RepID=A0A4D9D7M3_9STRA|nr:hypothetical protein NSK_001732 [Nannochloropsis salina CCMP1776]|eukprot:TFJ87400.1 hypothetical protein NSK_001732 [Nannochloropsis salina CCMP1776]